MSQNLATADWTALVPNPGAQPEATPSRLRAVTALPGAARSRAGAPKLVFAFIAVAAVAAIVVIQLLLSVGLSQGAYQLSSLESQSRQLGWQRQELATDVAAISSPQIIASNAEKIGMTMGGTPAYISLSNGKIVGVPSEAGTKGAIVQQSPSKIGNSLVTGATGATVPGAVVGATPSTSAPSGPVSLDAGLPAPQTH